MKTRKLTALLIAAAVSTIIATPAESQEQPAAFNKNLARQHLGTNLFVYNADNKTYVPTEAAAAWLDDDVTTGWPPQAGKQYYLMALPEPQLMTNFEISTRGGSGTLSLYAGDEPAVPGANSWTPMAKEVNLEKINEQALKQPFSRFAKYLLIETDLADTAPWYSLYVYGNRPASDFALAKREDAINPDAIFGPYVNSQTAFSYSSLYANGRVTYANTNADLSTRHQAIDDNPATGLRIAPAGDTPSFEIRYSEARTVQRVAVLADADAKGKLDLFLVDGAGETPVATANLVPTVSMVFDGSNPRSSIDFPATKADAIVARWVPEDGSQSIEIRELNSFGDLELATYAVSAQPEAIAMQGDGETYAAVTDSDYLYEGDGKEVVDSKKSILPPVGEFLPGKSPFVPGTLGFPPNLPPREVPLSE